MTTTPVVRSLGLLRLATGLALVLAPRRTTATWSHAAAALPGGQLAARSLGGREVALAVGLLTAPPSHRARWLVAATVADVVDVGATAASLRRLPLGAGAAATLALGTVAAVAQAWAALEAGR